MSRIATPEESQIRKITLQFWNIYRGVRQNNGFAMPSFSNANTVDKMAFRAIAKEAIERGMDK